MEKFKQLVKEANKAFETADHLAYVTYPVVNDSRLIVNITENIYIALKKGVEAILYYEWLYKRIYNLSDNFDTNLQIFKDNIAKKYDFSQKDLDLIDNIKQIMDHRLKCSMEFSRKDRFVLASPNYQLKVLSLPTVKNYLIGVKVFLNKLNSIDIQNDGRFRR
ncbi:MAG: hypothetical protein V1815_03205 [Candidatus Woesearchaeota archaeon]